MFKIKHIALGLSATLMLILGVACGNDQEEDLAACETLAEGFAIGKGTGLTEEEIADFLMREMDWTSGEFLLILARCNELMGRTPPP